MTIWSWSGPYLLQVCSQSGHSLVSVIGSKWLKIWSEIQDDIQDDIQDNIQEDIQEDIQS